MEDPPAENGHFHLLFLFKGRKSWNLWMIDIPLHCWALEQNIRMQIFKEENEFDGRW